MAGGGRELQAEELDVIWCSLRPRRTWEAPGPKAQTRGVGVGNTSASLLTWDRRCRQQGGLGGKGAAVNGKGIHVPRAVMGMEGLPSPAWVP